MSEFVFLGLRMLIDGVDKKEFQKRFHNDIYDVLGDKIKKYTSIGMIEDKGDRIVLTPKAYYVSNSIMADFVL